MTNQSSHKNNIRGRLTQLIQEMRNKPTVVAVIMEGFLTRLGFGMIGFALPLYALSIGMNVAEIGLLYATRSIVTVLVKPFMGKVADSLGSKRILVTAVLLRCLVGFLFIFATLPWQLFVIRGLQGAMTAARDPSAMALIAEHGNKQRMASAFAWYSTARDFGRSLGYGLAGLLIVLLSYQWMFFIAFVLSCGALFTVIRYVKEHNEEYTGYVKPKQTVAREKDTDSTFGAKFLKYAGFGMMVAITAEMMRGLYPVIATQYANLTPAEAGIAASAAGIVILFAGPIFGWLSDRGNRKLVLSTRSFANCCSSLLYLYLPNFPGFLIGRLLDDTGKAAFRPAWGAVLAEISEKNKGKRAHTMAVMDTSMTIGEILGPIVAGALITAVGIPAMLTVRIIMAIITEIQAMLVFRK